MIERNREAPRCWFRRAVLAVIALLAACGTATPGPGTEGVAAPAPDATADAASDGEVVPSDVEVGTLDAELGTPDAEVSAPDAELGALDAEVGTPDAEVGTPDAEVSAPDAEVGTPDAEMSAPEAPAPPAELPPERHAAFVWRGFDHDWLRTILGFKVPHRISVLSSHVADEAHAAGATPASWSGTADFHFGQSTGVDGNYMKPVGRFGAFYAPGVIVTRTAVELAWTDDGTGGTYPQAISNKEAVAKLSLAELGQDGTPPEVHAALLSGFALASSCDDKKQPAGEPCNSDGFWPFRMELRAHPCLLGDDGLACPVSIDIHRAWTPNKGGDPLGADVKPFNDKLDFQVTVYLTVVSGPASALHVTHGPEITAAGMARDEEAETGTVTLDGAPGFAYGTVGLESWAFELHQTGSGPNNQHLGRYIGRLNFGVSDKGYSTTTGALKAGYTAQLWVPDTVIDSKVSYAVRAIGLQFQDGAVGKDHTVTGQICSNSTEQAPAFSKWEKCGTDAKFGPEQDESSEAIKAP